LILLWASDGSGRATNSRTARPENCQKNGPAQRCRYVLYR